MEKLYSCEQVAERYKVKIETVWAWIREKKLSAIQIGKSYRVQEKDLLEFEKSNKTVSDDTEE